jgi:hypothetical protein
MTRHAAKPRVAPIDPATLEKFTVVEVNRSQLVDAPYNPRILSEKAKAKLKLGIAKLGVLAPPVWNVRTGHIVSGHQRLAIMDALTGATEYTLHVAQVDLDPAREQEANLLMNNPQAMGEWDLEKLAPLLTADTVDLDATGFDVADVYQMFGDATLEGTQIDELASRLQEAQGWYDDLQTARDPDAGGPTDFYVVVVFKDVDDRTDFLTTMKLDDNQFQDGRTLRRLYAEAGVLPTANEASVEVTDPAEILKLQKAVKAELGKLRELGRFFLEPLTCYFCHEVLLDPALFVKKQYGDSRGAPLPEVDVVTMHHLDGDHTNNDRANLTLCHDSCHRGHHNQE